MRKYVVPIAALAGIALLSSSGNAAELILKSRAIPSGAAGSVPVIVRNVGNGGSLWGIDAGLNLGSANVSAVDAANAFKATTGYDSAKDVIVTGVPSVGGGAQPGIYFGYVKGGAGIAAGSSTQVGAGLLKLKVTGGAARDVYTITAPSYNVKNDGTGADVNRSGSTAATVNGSTVASETVTLFDGYLGGTAPSGANPDLRVPTHRVAVGAPGDLNGDGVLGPADLGNLAAVLVNKAAASWTDYKKITADVAPFNGYTPASPGSGTGLSYGDGVVGPSDLGLFAAKLVNKPSAANFPVPE